MTVAVGFCYGQTTQTPQWVSSYLAVILRDSATHRRIVGQFAYEVSGVHVPYARCKIVKAFLAHPAQPEWLWMIDTDATFADDILDRLLATANPETRPIVGGLAFGVRGLKDEHGEIIRNSVGASPLELFPTLYVWDEHGTQNITDYTPGEILQVSATGAHCLLIHRSVLSDPRWLEDGHPNAWFRTAVRGKQEVSEDQFFCIKAGAFGYPIHVDTGARTGHVKTFVADETLYLGQRGQ